MVAVEPDAGMRRLLVAGCPGVEAIDGTAEQIPLADDSVDAVFVAQAFHWFDDEAALMEIARVLRPSGALVLMWNVANGPAAPSITYVEELLAPICLETWDSLSHDEWCLGTHRLEPSLRREGLRPHARGAN